MLATPIAIGINSRRTTVKPAIDSGGVAFEQYFIEPPDIPDENVLPLYEAEKEFGRFE